MENKAILMDYAGSDKTHAIAAWASTFVELNVDMPEDVNLRVDALINHIQHNGKKVKTPEQLIEWLMDPSHEPHTSPFRASYFMFATINEMATHIQFLKHRVAMQAENAESARYKELKEDKFYLPEDWLDFGNEGRYWYDMLWQHTENANRMYHACLSALTRAGMPKNRAKETARYFKTYNSQINSVKIFSFDGLMQVYHKRKHGSGAQKEIADIVEQMVTEVKNIPGNPFAASLKAFGL